MNTGYTSVVGNMEARMLQPLLFRFGSSREGQVRIVGVNNTLPLPIRLLFPDLHQLAGVVDGRTALRVLDGKFVCSVEIRKFSGLCHFNLGHLGPLK